MLDWNTHAHAYQAKAAGHLWNSAAYGGVATLWLSPGYGKTMITLHAFKALRDAGLARTMLVVAPLRVIQTVWAQEIEEWASLNGLVACRLHGPKKERWLARRDVNIWLLNYEGIPWLADMVKAGKLREPFDVVCFDEIRRMKNAQGKRFKKMRPITALAKYRWGLTGTPASNGLMDLFGQFLILDGGAALGNRITHFRGEFFEQGWDGFTWIPRPGAQEIIEKRIEPYVFRADGHLDLPDFVMDTRKITLEPKARKEYEKFKRDLIAEFEGTTITAANAAVLMGKLKQVANGRVYDEHRNVIHIHDAKKEALLELIEELGDEQLLIAYEFNHDLEQILDVLGAEAPYLGAGVNETKAMAYVDAWNKREIQILPAHPASAGHGLNLQKGGAHHVLWWGPTFDLDHYIQFNDRLRRQGNEADAVIVHTFAAENTADESALKAREGKETVQDALLEALTAEFGGAIKVAEESETESETPMTELQFKPDAQQGQQQAQPNPFAQQGQQQAPQPNPFASQGQPAPQAQQPAPQQQQAQPNPFAPQAQQPAPQPQTQQPDTFQQQTGIPPQQNPFAQAGQQVDPAQVAAIQNDVAAQPPAQPAPQNPFAGGQPTQQPVEDAQVVQETRPATTGPVAQQQAVQEAQQAAYTPPAGNHVPLHMFVPADKLDKVLSAIGRALKDK